MSVSSIDSSTSSIDFSQLRKKIADRMAEKMLKDLDSDGDGAISKSELAKASQTSASSSSSSTSKADSADTASLDELFKAMDADGDGSVSKSELSAFLEKAGPPQGPPPAGGPPPSGGPPGPPRDEANPVETSSTSTKASNTSSTSSSSLSTDPADTNADGTVSTEERMAFAYQQLMAALQRLGESASRSESTSTLSVTS
jgi:hypothetical protein